MAQQDKILERIKRCERSTADADPTEPIDDSDDDAVDEHEYVVESIIGHFHTPRGFWFLVKWVDYTVPTWEHESLLEAGKRVTEYFKSVCQSEE